MIKRFFLAALAAVALTMGFTSCKDDDGYKPFTGDYKLTGFVNVCGQNIDDDEYYHIMSTYCEFLGASGEDVEFTINGKDSLDCVSNIQKCCQKAEAKLAGQTWNGYYTAEARSGKISFYSHKYGVKGDNSIIDIVIGYFPFVTLVNAERTGRYGFEYWKPTETKEMSGDTFVSGLFTYYAGINECVPPTQSWSSSVYHSLKSTIYGSHRNFVGLSQPYYTMDDVQTMIQNDDPKLNTLVGDVKVLYFYKGTYPQEFTYKGAKYEVCGSTLNGTWKPLSLNFDNAGPYMYLYVSHDVKHFGRVLNGKWCSFVYKVNDFFYGDTKGERQETSELVQGIYMDDNGNMSDHYEDGMDFHKESGDEAGFLKLRVGYLYMDEVPDKLEVVDLGLSSGTKWASKNVGAHKTEDYGSYFAWGETVPYGMEDTSNAQNYSSTGSYDKLRFEWSTYKWCNGTSIVSKYNQDDYMTVLDAEDDAATACLGEHWRTPYKSDIRELIDECDWTWTTQNGVTGYVVKSKTNGNSIFLPAAGYRSKNDLLGEEDYVYIWSANCDFDVPYRAYYMNRSTKGYSINTEQRCLGLPVRAVYVE